MTTPRDLAHALSLWTPGDAPAAHWFLPELKVMLRAEFAGAYRPAATEAGWSLDFMHGTSTAADYVGIFRDYVDKLPRSESFLALGNPHLVQREQRDRVFLLSEIVRVQRLGERAEPFHSLFRQLGIAGHDQLRVLICDGPQQLAWVGATRQEPFTRREALALRRLVQPLRERLRLERHVATPRLLSAALDAALEALPIAAFVLGPKLRIECANRLGLALVERDRAGVLEALRRSERAAESAKATTSAFAITRLVAPGLSRYLLAVQRQPDPVVVQVMRAQKAWALTTRQARILELMANGDSNKEIAVALACAESTVETHVTELFRRSGARSRAGLVGRLLALG